jgi:hypothetical protein
MKSFEYVISPDLQQIPCFSLLQTAGCRLAGDGVYSKKSAHKSGHFIFASLRIEPP